MPYHHLLRILFCYPLYYPPFKGITLFLPERHGSPEFPLRPGPSKAAFFKIRILYRNEVIGSQFCSTRRCHALWTWLTLKVFLLWAFQAKIRSTACSAV